MCLVVGSVDDRIRQTHLRWNRGRQFNNAAGTGDESQIEVILILWTRRLRRRPAIARLITAITLPACLPATVLENRLAAACGRLHELAAGGCDAVRSLSAYFRNRQRERLDQERQDEQNA